MLSHIIKTIQFLSLDVVAGALGVGYLFIRMLEITPPDIWWIVLALSVWIFYSVDHLLDASRKKEFAFIDRHLFFYRNKRLLIFVVIITSIINLVLIVSFLDVMIMMFGSILSIVTILYFIILNKSGDKFRRSIPKELIISIIYTLGVALGPIYWYDSTPTLFEIMIMIIIGLLAFSEGVIVSVYEYELDTADNHSSFAQRVGIESTNKFIVSIHIIIEIALIISFFRVDGFFNYAVIVIVLLMNFLLGLLMMLYGSRFTKKNYRLIGELTFVLPFLLVII